MRFRAANNMIHTDSPCAACAAWDDYKRTQWWLNRTLVAVAVLVGFAVGAWLQ